MNEHITEKYGVPEIENVAYRKRIEELADAIENTIHCIGHINIDEYIDNDILKGQLFDKIIIYDTHLSWLKKLVIFINNDSYFKNTPIEDTYAVTPLTETDKSIISKTDECIEVGTIIMYIGHDKPDVASILFHEIMHIYDFWKNDNIWMNDVQYRFQNFDEAVYNFSQYTDVNTLTAEEIHLIITDAMYYANLTESHAFMESVNFEIQKFISGLKRRHAYIRSSVFPKISKELYNIFQYYRLIEKITWIDDEMKNEYWKIYKTEIHKAYHDFSKLDDVLKYIYRKLSKMVSHGMKLMNYYAEMDNIKMNEGYSAHAYRQTHRPFFE